MTEITPDQATPHPARRYDMDWLRIIAFGILIFYHIGMFYVSWDWHVKSPRIIEAAEPFMLIFSPWRLDLLFLISGIGSGFLLDKMSAWRFSGARFHRLFWPILFGMFVIVPPQAYFELHDAVRLGQIPVFNDNYFEFMGKYVTAYEGWCDTEGCLEVPTWNHMWFVVYLLVYSLIAALIWPVLKVLRKVQMPAWCFFVLPFLVMWALRATLFPIFGDTHGLTDDWYLHSLYLFLFLLGMLVARADAIFALCARWRWLTLGIAIVAYAIFVSFALGYLPFEKTPLNHIAIRAVRELMAWMAICTLIGFAHRYLAHSNGPIRRRLTEAVFPFYIAHQTVTVVSAFYLSKLNLPIGLEFALVVAATVAGCVVTYGLARLIPVLRPFLGLPFRDKA